MNAKQSTEASAAKAAPRTQKPLILKLSDEVAAGKMTFDETLMLDQVALARIALKQRAESAKSTLVRFEGETDYGFGVRSLCTLSLKELQAKYL